MLIFAQNNFVHRDIKTANILVDSHAQVMIADFGLARSWTGPGSGFGSIYPSGPNGTVNGDGDGAPRKRGDAPARHE